MELIVATGSFLSTPGIASWGTAHGETAHAALGLAKGLRLLGHRAMLVAPLDDDAAQSGLGLARRLSPLKFTLGGVAHERIVFDARLPSGVEVVLLGGESPRDVAIETDPLEVARRWAWFGHAVSALALQKLGAVRTSQEELDGVITVGEHASFAALAIRENGKLHQHEEGAPSPRLLAGLSRVVVPIDPTYDTPLPRTALASIGLGDELFSPEGIEFYGEASLTKAGIIAADRVVALGEAQRVSLTKVGSQHRLDGVFRARGADVVSIGSGIDQAQYSPATDPHLPARFDAEDLTGKTRARAPVLADLELETATGIPLLVVMGPVERGAETALAAAIGHALRGEVLVAVLRPDAKTDGVLDTALERLARTHRGRLAVRHGATEPFLHRALAAADFVLLVEGHGATGTPARAALRYGAIPVAVRTPAMEEAIVDVDASLATGTGILAPTFGETDLFGAIQRAVSAYQLPGFRKLQRRAMRIDGGWERAARRLERLLKQLEE